MFRNRSSNGNLFALASICAMGVSAGAVGCSGSGPQSASNTGSTATDSYTEDSMISTNNNETAFTPPDSCNCCLDDMSGRATALVVDLLNGAVHVVAGDTGWLPQAGGDIVATTLNADIKELVTAKILHSEAKGKANTVDANVTTEVSISLSVLDDVLQKLNLGTLLDDLNLGGLAGIGALQLPDIKVTVLSSQASAYCNGGEPVSKASSQIAELIVDGKAIEVTADKDFVIPVGPLTITANEQDNPSATSSEVKALHIHLDNLLDIVVSDAIAGIECTCPT